MLIEFIGMFNVSDESIRVLEKKGEVADAVRCTYKTQTDTAFFDQLKDTGTINTPILLF